MFTDLTATPISETIRLISDQRLSGELLIHAGGAVRGVFFDAGRIVYAASNRASESVAESRASVTRADLEDLGRARGVVFSSFALETGQAIFEPRPCVIPLELRMSLSVPELLFEGVRHMRNPGLVRRGLGDLDRSVVRGAVAPFPLEEHRWAPEEREILGIASRPATLRRLAWSPEGGVTPSRLRATYALLAGGVLEGVSPAILAFPQSAAAPPPQSAAAPPPSATHAPEVAGNGDARTGGASPAQGRTSPVSATAKGAAYADHLLLEGQARMLVNDFVNAANAYAKLVEHAPDVPGYRLRLALALSRHPSTAPRAEAEFLEALRLDAGNADIHYQVGLYYKRMKDRTRAFTEFRTAVRLDPRHRGARQELEAVSPKGSSLLAGLRRLFG